MSGTNDEAYEEYVLSDEENKEDDVVPDPYADDDDDESDDGYSATKTTGDVDADEKDDADNYVDDDDGEGFKAWVCKSVAADVKELDDLPNVRCAYVIDKGSKKIHIFFAIAKERFNLSAERARSYMLDPSMHICFKMTFGKYYVGDVLSHSRTVSEVKPECPEIFKNFVHAKVTDKIHASIFTEGKPCALSWFLYQRLTAYINGDVASPAEIAKAAKKGTTALLPGKPGIWPPHLEPRGWEEPIETKFVRSEVRQIMRNLDLEEDQAERLLSACDEDVEAALDLIHDDFKRFSIIVGDDETATAETTTATTAGTATVDDDEKGSADDTVHTSLFASIDAIREAREKVRDLKRADAKFIRHATGSIEGKARFLGRDARFGHGIIPKDALKGVVTRFFLLDGNASKAPTELRRLVDPPEMDRSAGSADSEVIWQYFADRPGRETLKGSKWQTYDPAVSAKLSEAHKTFKTGAGPTSVAFTSGKKSYKVDLKLKRQTSNSSGFERKVRRVTRGSLRLEAWMYDQENAFQGYIDLYNAFSSESKVRMKELRTMKKYGRRAATAPSPPKLAATKSSDGDALPPAPPSLLKQMSTGGKKRYEMNQIEKRLAKSNFLVRVVLKSQEIMRSYTTHCIVCGDPLQYPGAKPACCNQRLCTYRFNALGLGLDIRKALVEQQDMFELLVLFFYMCCQNAGKTIWPQAWAWDLKDPKMVYPYLLAGTHKDDSRDIFYESDYKAKKPQLRGLKNLQAIVAKMPKVRTIAQWALLGKDSEGRYPLYKKMHDCDKESGLLLPLLRWLHTSNTSHIRRLKKSEMLQQVDSQYQFVLMTGSMAKETRFQELKRNTSFARKVMSKWNVANVQSALTAAHNKRKSEVVGLLTDGTSLYMAKARLAVATEAVTMAQIRLAKDKSVKDIDSRVVDTALAIVKKSVADVVKRVYDNFKSQRDAMIAAGKPPKIDSRTKATATNATAVPGAGTNGSYFCWHGSQLARWHIILRTGLRNLSGTKLQAFGTAYGEGCYFAKDLNTSMGYANNSCAIWPNCEFDGASLKGINVRCASMCEVIHRPEDFTSINPYYVVPNEDYITTRFIFLFKNNPKSVNAMDVKIPTGIHYGDEWE